MPNKVESLPMGKIVAEGTTQARGYDEALEKRYVEAMKDGAQFPPVVVFGAGGSFYLADGFHRRGAAIRLEQKELRAEIHQPFEGETAQRSAILHAVGANAAHGHNRSDKDKRHAVEMLLRDPEWSKWTDREIARQCRVGHPFVAKQRTRLINAGAVKGPKKRTTKRGGKTYEVDTSKIGKSSRKKVTSEHKKVAKQVRESQKGKTKESQDGWTKECDKSCDVIADILSKLCKAWESAQRPAQIHMSPVIKQTTKGMV